MIDNPHAEPILPEFEENELTRAEYIAALSHFYRGELHRATMWRVRLDTTTNWSIVSVMALVTFSLGDPSHSHVGILVGMALVFTFLTIEARRFRFFDVWRARTRMLEENFVAPIVKRDLKSPIGRWGQMVAEDLFRPKFKVTWHQALKARLLRNYAPLFVILLVSWFIKINVPSLAETEDTDAVVATWWERLEVGTIPPWVSMLFILLLYAYLLGVIIFARRTPPPEVEYWQSSTAEIGALDT